MDTAAHAFIARHPYGVVSSLSPAGLPQSALVGIAVTPDLEIIFDTLKTSRKYPNLIANPNCSFVIGSGEQTLQLEGDALEPPPPQLALYQHIYLSAWPEGQLRSTSTDLAYFVVRPRWIRYSDFATTPTLIEELTF